jgi:FAD synthase
MKYLDVSFEDLNIQEELFLTIGNFDGVHRGHQQVLNNLTTDSKISKLNQLYYLLILILKYFLIMKKTF